MFPTTIDRKGLYPTEAVYLIENSSSAAADTIQLETTASSGIYQIIVDIDSFLDDYSFERDITKSLMLISENVLSKVWDTPEEDEAWADL